MFYLLNFLLFLCNAAIFLYNIDVYKLLKLLTPNNYQLVVALYVMSLKLRFRQWLGNVVERVENGQYIVTLLINGKLAKIALEHETRVPTAIEDDEHVDITDHAIPFFRMKCGCIGPDYFFSDKMFLRYADGTIVELKSHQE